jgi:hypothetical protein
MAHDCQTGVRIPKEHSQLLETQLLQNGFLIWTPSPAVTCAKMIHGPQPGDADSGAGDAVAWWYSEVSSVRYLLSLLLCCSR